MQIDFIVAKTLCTASEFSLLQDARPKSLTQFGTAELKRKLQRARDLADKWRDRAKSQGHSTDGSAMRSIRKYALFASAVERFEAKLEKIAEAPAAKVSKKTAAAEKLAAQQAANRMAAKLPARKNDKKAAAKKTASKKTAVKKTAAKKVASPAMPKSPTKKASRKPVDLQAAAEQHARRTSLRVAASGQDSRVRGHVSAQGRRNQAARSSRKRS